MVTVSLVTVTQPINGKPVSMTTLVSNKVHLFTGWREFTNG